MVMILALGFIGSICYFLVSAARWAWGLPEPAATKQAATKQAATEPMVVEFLPRTYSTDSACGKKRWIKLILRSSRFQWHLKFTFSGTAVQDGTQPIVAKGMKRRNDLRDLCRCIDFRQIPLLDDKVTEVILSLDPSPESVKLPYTTQPSADSEYASVISHLWVRTLEDPLRIRFPVHDSSNGIPARRLSEIREKEELNGDSVYKVIVCHMHCFPFHACALTSLPGRANAARCLALSGPPFIDRAFRAERTNPLPTYAFPAGMGVPSVPARHTRDGDGARSLADALG